MNDKQKDSRLIWNELDREILLETPVYTILRSSRRSPEGFDADYYLMDAPNWVNVVALTVDDQDRECFVMVRQFRHGSRKISLEFPGGVVDPGESPQAAVDRELKEETGYVAESMVLLGSVNPNPALMGNRCYTYFASTAWPRARRSPEHDEFIDLELVPVAELLEGTRSQEFDHAMMHVALGFFRSYALAAAEER